MGRLAEKIQRCLQEDRYVIGLHASERLEERGIMEWQLLAEMDDAIVLRERSSSRPNPVVELSLMLPEGTEVKMVWAYLKSIDVAKLVTVHELDEF